MQISGGGVSANEYSRNVLDSKETIGVASNKLNGATSLGCLTNNASRRKLLQLNKLNKNF